jgi:hypothetical protein
LLGAERKHDSATVNVQIRRLFLKIARLERMLQLGKFQMLGFARGSLLKNYWNGLVVQNFGIGIPSLPNSLHTKLLPYIYIRHKTMILKRIQGSRNRSIEQ